MTGRTTIIRDGDGRTLATAYDGDAARARLLEADDGEHAAALVAGAATKTEVAADATAEAIVRGVRAARGVPVYPAVGDLEEHTR